MKVRSRLCAALLAAGRPIAASDLGEALGIPATSVRDAIEDLQVTLDASSLGLLVEEVAGGFRLVLHPSVVPDLHAFLAPPPLPHLSHAAIETLALIAYHQPISRGELEAARGASCVSTLETLQERELVKVVGRKEVIGRPLLYGTTDRFLVEFGLASLDELPNLGKSADAFLRT